ncbi:titin [Chelonus insularis]|uniref:titin n=1 Tax=Chelonus insularis TaxID=460826 RepID=UPI0015892EF5|nr:titin [Chelonus insularis]
MVNSCLEIGLISLKDEKRKKKKKKEEISYGGGRLVGTMDHERGRTSRASSTSSLGREVRCACQYFQSDSLLPERRAMMLSRPSSRNEQKPTVTSGICEHEYEPVGAGRSPKTTGSAPVVRIIDTDVAPVADSDDSIDIRSKFTLGPRLDGDDVILPLDGRIEDSAMEGRELGSGDLSEEVETAQQFQDRLEERFLTAATPCTESRTDGEVNTSQVDSSAMEELPLRRGARGLPQKIRSQAGKLRSRLKNIQRPNFNFPIDRHRSPKDKSPEKSKSRSSDKSSEKSRTSEKLKKTTDKRSRMERIRASLPERPKFSFPDRPKFNLPDRPKFNFPQKSKFHLPERAKINLPKMPTRASFRFPNLPGRRKTPSLSEQQRQYSNESTAGSRKNIFDFSTVPRLFDKKSKGHSDYATSSPKDSRAQSSAESATLPRTKKPRATFGSRWTQRFTDIKFADDDEGPAAIETEKPWKHPGFEKPRLSLRGQESLEESEALPWEESDERRRSLQVEELPYDEDVKNDEITQRDILSRQPKIFHGDSEDSYELPQIDPRLYGDQDIEIEDSEKDREMYRVAFEPIDSRDYKKHMTTRDKEENKEEDMEEDEEGEEPIEDEEHMSSELEEDTSARSDREQQASSGSSCDRRRRGVIEEIDSDEFFLRQKGISQDDMHVGKYLTSEIRDALRTPINALAHEVIMVTPKPPQRPPRTRSFRKRKESLESFDTAPPIRPKRLFRRSEESDYDPNLQDNDDSISESRHKIVYHAESTALDLDRQEPLDDIVIVKPLRRKSKTSLRSSSLVPSEIIKESSPEPIQSLPPPVVPMRRKRRDQTMKFQDRNIRMNGVESCNGHYSPEERKEMPRPKSEPPMKPKVDDDYIESAPIPPKRLSRSRTTSIIQDDDRTSRGAESIPDMGYVEDEEIPDYNSKLDFSGYAVIEKREKPPRPPPPRKRKNHKFATTPRPSPPRRPTRNYSTLRPRSLPVENGFRIPQDNEVTSYVEIESEEEEEEEDHKNLVSGEVLSKMVGRPLPAPPRPPRSRKDRKSIQPNNIKSDLDTDNAQEFSAGMEVYASTQTDPLPDDLIIEEEITQAKLVVTPSRSGSQIMVSTERIPTPHYFKSSSPQAISHERIPSPTQDFYLRTSARSEPDIRGSRISVERETRIPEVPPLPTQAIYVDEVQRPRRKSPSVSREVEEQPERPLSRIVGIEEFEERLSTFLTNETLKIASLEVGDLKVDKLSVSNLEAHKISASEIDAIVVSATEFSGTKEEESVPIIPPSLLEELIAIRTQLELVSQAQDSHTYSESPIKIIDDSTTESTLIEGKSEIKRSSKVSTEETSQSTRLQLEPASKASESRELFSTQSFSSQEQQKILSSEPVIERSKENIKEKSSEIKREDKTDTKPSSRSGSPIRSGLRQTASPVRSLPPVISVTPDTPDAMHTFSETTEIKPQRAIITYSSDIESSERPPSPSSRPSTPLSRPISPPLQNQQFIAFSASQIPSQFFTLSSLQRNSHQITDEPSIIDMTQQLIRALRLAGKRAMRHFVNYVVSRVSQEESEAKIKEIELAICALLLIIAGLIIVCFGAPKTITHHHHWDYFNPPRL